MSATPGLGNVSAVEQPGHEILAPVAQGITSASKARYTWNDYSHLRLDAVVYLPLQRISLHDLSRIEPGTVFRSALRFTEDLFLRVGDSFMANVSLEPAGSSRGVRINSFDARPQFFPEVAATNLGPGEEAQLTPEARNLRQCTVPLALCFGRRSLLLKDALLLAPGQLFNMDCPLLEPASLLVNNRVIAYGSPMLHSNFYSVLVTELARPDSNGPVH